MIHIDTKKLGRIEKTGHRATGDRRDRSPGAGWEVLFVAIDDHARIAYAELYPDETQENACRYWRTRTSAIPRQALHPERY